MRENCEECGRMWREYSDAVNDHLRLQGKLDIAVLAYHASAVVQLTPEVQKAEKRRSEARTAIRDHEANVHGGR